ncbi:MAG: GH3 auxin-responsive promoter family protein [Planctomycetota bacterium]
MLSADRLAVARNQACRRALLLGLGAAVRLVRRALRRRLADHRRAQAALRARLRIRANTPVRTWGPEVEAQVAAWAQGRRGVRFALTSGSTARPKRIPFTPARLRRIKRGSWEGALQVFHAEGIDRASLFVLAALKRDESLSTLLLDDGGRTPFAEGLLMPSKLLWEEELAQLLDRFGPTACRLWLCVLADPGMLYATNPSTLAVFLERLECAWEESSALVRAALRAPASLPPLAREVLRRVAAPGWEERSARVAEAEAAPPIEHFLPGLRSYACWDGGYVTPFLQRIARFLPAPRFHHAPMYSMSTETVETLLYTEGGRSHFLPMAPGVLYEFLPEEASDADLDALLPAWALEPGRAYTMVVSDVYGLVRYQTEDLFAVRERVRGLPDLRFVRRRGLAYSFTGEKLTGEQVTAAMDALRDEVPTLRAAGVQLTLVPSTDDVPHYRLVLAWPGRIHEDVSPNAAAAAFERHLMRQNEEFVTKRESLRLGPTRGASLAYDDLAAALQADPAAPGMRGWETQFKLLPLTRRTWEEVGLSATAEALPG